MQQHNVAQKHTHTQPFYSSLDFVRDRPGKPAPEETFTHSHPSWSSNIPICFLLPVCVCVCSSIYYYDPWHPPNSIYVLYSLFPQSLSKFSLVYLLAWHPPLHTPYISSSNHYLLFCSTCPYHRNLFCCSTEIMSSNPSFSLNSQL